MVSEELRGEYWAVVRKTRQSGRISPAVVRKAEGQWEGFDDDVVEDALRIHMGKCRKQKECYTLGIMRNLQKHRDDGKEAKGGNM